ncbi:hypothetical protein HMPREF1141_1942 [Clostridium sp. MSTE9]|nr:hypothetical protein HMPREF1141_1942 [Clostridium sp. MSTE9]
MIGTKKTPAFCNLFRPHFSGASVKKARPCQSIWFAARTEILLYLFVCKEIQPVV